MASVQKVTTKKSFIGGKLVQSGTLVTINEGDFGKPRPGHDKPGKARFTNLADPHGYVPAAEPEPVANPIPPVPPAQTGGDGVVEEEGVQRAIADEGFDPAPVLEGTIDDVEARLPGLTADQLDLVAGAEKAGEDRKGVADAIEKARKALA